MWFRVELDKAGAILTCEEVAGTTAPSRFVRYIEAPDKAKACSLAKQWWELQLQRCRDAKARLRERRIAGGQCSECETPALAGRRMCTRHAQAVTAAAARTAARRKSGDVRDLRRGDKTPEQRLAFHQERSLKVSVVLRELDRRGADGLRQWLVSMLTGQENANAA